MARTLLIWRVSVAAGAVTLLASHGAAVVDASPLAAGPGRWHEVGRLATARADHTATVLGGQRCAGAPDIRPPWCGQVLVAGGRGGVANLPLTSSEVFDPDARTWSPAPDLPAPRADHTASSLADGGVLVAGGTDAGGEPLADAVIFRPAGAGGSWVGGGSLGEARALQAATTLADGRVLVAGGTGTGGRALASTEVFDPTVLRWSAGPALATPRSGAAAALLADGRVLVIGGTGATGQPLASAEVLDPRGPASEPSTPIAPMAAARGRPKATLLHDGRVVATGDGSSQAYDPARGTWLPPVPMAAAGAGHAAAPLADGRVVVTGGDDGAGGALASAGVFDPATGTATTVDDLLVSRRGHSATLLEDGTVLVVGGGAAGRPEASAEVFDPLAVAQPPTLVAVSPGASALDTTAAVTLGGRGLGAVRSVSFGGAEGRDVRAVSDAEVLVTSPPRTEATTVDVTVTAPSGTSVSGAARFTYAPPPVVTGVEPDAGSVAGATRVVVHGTGVGVPGAAVLFGDVSATITAPTAAGDLEALSPPHAPGPVDVTVRTPAGTSAASTVDRFRFGDGSWAAAAPLPGARYNSTATDLEDGRVLVVGGTDDFTPGRATTLASAELYDPSTGTWSATGSVAVGRSSHTATRLADGRVLVAGGLGVDPARGFDQDTLIAPAATLAVDDVTGRDGQEVSSAVAAHVGVAPAPDRPDLRVSASSDPPAGSPVAIGSSLTYTFRYFNSGGRPAAGVLTDPLPDALDFVGASPGGTFDPSNRTVAFDLGPVASGTSATAPAGTVSVTVALRTFPQNPDTSGGLENAAHLDGATSNMLRHEVVGGDPGPGPVPRIAVSADPPDGAAVRPGTHITYTFSIFNPGGAPQDGAVLRDTLPLELDFVAGDGATFDPDTRVVTFAPVTVAPGTTAASPATTRQLTVAVTARSEAMGALTSAEIYDPRKGSWSPAQPMHVARLSHTATLLPDGRVLVAGGAFQEDRPPTTSSAELYDPTSGAWTETGPLAGTCGSATVECGRSNHTATLLPDGRVLVTGGIGNRPGRPGDAPASVDTTAQLGDDQTSGATHPLNPDPATPVRLVASTTPARGAVVRPGDVIVATYAAVGGGPAPVTVALATLALPTSVDFVDAGPGATYNPRNRIVTFAPITVAPGALPAPAAWVEVRVRATAAVGGGAVPDGSPLDITVGRALVEKTAVAADTASFTVLTRDDPGAAPRLVTTADPGSGQVVASGSRITYTFAYYDTGRSPATGIVLRDVIKQDAAFVAASGGGRFDPVTSTVTFPPVTIDAGTTADHPAGTFTVTVEVEGPVDALTAADVFDPATGAWQATGSLQVGRFGQTATLLGTRPCGGRCGQVLVAGGITRVPGGTSGPPGAPAYTAVAELYDPVRGAFSTAALGRQERGGHTATLLPDGTVLVAGAAMVFAGAQSPETASAEIYDPVADAWQDTAPMLTARGDHTATLIGGPACQPGAGPAYCGSVLVAGGAGTGRTALGAPVATGRAERYTPVALPPAVTSVHPATGPTAGGTVVTIEGSGFRDVAAVTFGDLPAAEVHVTSPTSLTSVSPAQASGTVDITVTTRAGRSGAGAATGFTYEISRPPSAVTDLAARLTAPSSVVLSFSAPPADGPFGPPADAFVVMQSTTPILDERSFAAATSLCQPACALSPGDVGQPLTLTVDDLAPGQTLHWALEAENADGQRGPLSNEASVTTAGSSLPPAAAAAAAAAAATTAAAPAASGAPPAAEQSPPPQAAAPVAPPSSAPTIKRPAGEALPPGRGSGGLPTWAVLGIWAVFVVGAGGLGSVANRRIRGPGSGRAR
ncbi:MAG: kelch repeat-containing protein [Acidimicrobiales bacterium]